MIFPDGRAVSGFKTLHRHARPHHFGETIDIQRGNAQPFFNFAAHRLRPRLGAKHADAQGTGAGIAAHLTLQLFNQVQAVRRRHHDHIRLEIADQLRLLLRLAAGHRDHRRSQTLGTVVRPQPAGEEPVTVSDVNFILRAAPGGAQGTGDDIGPVVDIILGIPHHGRLSGGARRGMDAYHLFHWHRKGIKRVVVAQILLGGAREFLQVRQLGEIVRVNARGIKLAFVHRNVVVGVVQRPLQARGLQRLQFINGRGFDRIKLCCIYHRRVLTLLFAQTRSRIMAMP